MTVKDNNKSITVEFFIDDLNETAKDAINDLFEDNNWDVYPIATLEVAKDY